MFCRIWQNHHTQPATSWKRIGTMQLLAAASLIQLSSVFVAEVQTQVTLMLGTMGENKQTKKKP